METPANKTIMRIECWHGVLLLILAGILAPAKLIELRALVLGGLFMGINFFLLSYGVRLVLTPLAGQGRVKAGVGLLVLKFVLFLGLVTTLFFNFEIDAISFALGVSTLLAAIVFEALRSSGKLGT